MRRRSSVLPSAHQLSPASFFVASTQHIRWYQHLHATLWLALLQSTVWLVATQASLVTLCALPSRAAYRKSSTSRYCREKIAFPNKTFSFSTDSLLLPVLFSSVLFRLIRFCSPPYCQGQACARGGLPPMPRHQLCVFLLCPPDQLRQLKYHLRLAGPLVTRATVPYSYSSRSGLHTIRTGVSYLGYMLIQGGPRPYHHLPPSWT
jgi:hypothetical protein